MSIEVMLILYLQKGYLNKSMPPLHKVIKMNNEFFCSKCRRFKKLDYKHSGKGCRVICIGCHESMSKKQKSKVSRGPKDKTQSAFDKDVVYLTTKEVAAMSGVVISTVARDIRGGDINALWASVPSNNYRGRVAAWLVHPADADAYVKMRLSK